MPAVLTGCTQLVPEHQSTARQRSTGILSADSVRITTATNLEEDGHGTQRRNGKGTVPKYCQRQKEEKTRESRPLLFFFCQFFCLRSSLLPIPLAASPLVFATSLARSRALPNKLPATQAIFLEPTALPQSDTVHFSHTVLFSVPLLPSFPPSP